MEKMPGTFWCFTLGVMVGSILVIALSLSRIARALSILAGIN